MVERQVVRRREDGWRWQNLYTRRPYAEQKYQSSSRSVQHTPSVVNQDPLCRCSVYESGSRTEAWPTSLKIPVNHNHSDCCNISKDYGSSTLYRATSCVLGTVTLLLAIKTSTLSPNTPDVTRLPHRLISPNHFVKTLSCIPYTKCRLTTYRPVSKCCTGRVQRVKKQ
ncbi:hypothetical protein BaRGS_00017986 [Batillaria attramentaria]|uniref:Uncharacterized protein n=1 Tax=Batillaria attramentaria TaxID=370345 RepID=A0ABD0KU97_9CAEN